MPERDSSPESTSSGLVSGTGPVMAAPILVDGRMSGFVYFGVDDERIGGAHGMTYDMHMYWVRRLEETHATGRSAAEAVRSLLGHRGPTGIGELSRDLRRYEGGWREVDEILKPTLYADKRAARASRPTRENIDAALRGLLPVSPQIAEQVRLLDESLAVKAVPEPVILLVTARRAELPDQISRGDRVHEPTYRFGYMVSPEREFPDAEVVITLRVDTGVPALFRDPARTGDLPYLLLGRGMDWEVTRVVELSGRLRIFGQTIGVRAGPLVRSPVSEPG